MINNNNVNNGYYKYKTESNIYNKSCLNKFPKDTVNFGHRDNCQEDNNCKGNKTALYATLGSILGLTVATVAVFLINKKTNFISNLFNKTQPKPSNETPTPEFVNKSLKMNNTSSIQHNPIKQQNIIDNTPSIQNNPIEQQNIIDNTPVNSSDSTNEQVNKIVTTLKNMLNTGKEELTDQEISQLEPIINATTKLNFHDTEEITFFDNCKLTIPKKTNEYLKQIELTEQVFQQLDKETLKKFNSIPFYTNTTWNAIDKIFKNIINLNNIDINNISKVKIDFSENSDFKKILACVKATKDFVYPKDTGYWQTPKDYVSEAFEVGASQLFNLGVCRNDANLVQHLLEPWSNEKTLGVYHILDGNHAYNILYNPQDTTFYHFDTFGSNLNFYKIDTHTKDNKLSQYISQQYVDKNIYNNFGQIDTKYSK